MASPWVEVLSTVRFATTDEQAASALAYKKCGKGILGEAKAADALPLHTIVCPMTCWYDLCSDRGKAPSHDKAAFVCLVAKCPTRGVATRTGRACAAHRLSL